MSAYGGLLPVETGVLPSQKLMLTNLLTDQDLACRVARVVRTREGKTLAEWMREQALKSARQVPADPMELVLSEVAALRYMLLTLFHSTAQARREGAELLPETVLQIRDAADRRKLQTARKMLDDFMNQNAAGGQP